MFRPMRRSRQALPKEECEQILRRGSSGVLALYGDGGYPYAVPLSYVYENGKLLFHCAKAGHKIDAIRHSAKASFCVIDQDHVVPEEYTTYFRSVIVFGEVRVLEEEAEKRAAVEALAIKYAPQDTAGSRRRAIEQEWAPLCMLELSVAHMSGKEAAELAKTRPARKVTKE
ncbi:MAG TPA: pyridoxamine 5'-phosphate oxidase family protein [Candidatus Aphodoplasma excrementigallinarum]|uniref:Pyridoxamine 5'-phosphate oxidase family protein n=1 Tax=Candidatus Aphodoplasma excrementigallinarum TaxID=2840673 RepID=A0A9D1T0F5_9FIRM|nr:pyridoxamine 5'-phosphate oxidase family protein [Candidatus Aphodoplasma excrementigallinarum]